METAPPTDRPPDQPPPAAPPQANSPDPMLRTVPLFLAGVIGIAFVGFFVGIRQGAPRPEPKPVAQEAPAPHPEAIPATTYREFDRRRQGPNRDWKTTFTSLPQPKLDLFAKPFRSDAGRRAALEQRSSRRAFDGAPPVVPHPIDQRSTASCLACHGEGVAIDPSPQRVVRAPKLSHGVLANCTQCHAEKQAVELEPMPEPENTFVGKPAPAGGRRAWNGAPPTVPHTVFMRESCLSCHGPAGAEPIRTTHAWRTNCLQCHAPSAVLDQVTAAESAPGPAESQP